MRAGRVMLDQLHDLASRNYAGWLNSLRETGYNIHLYYFWLSDVELAIARVAARVRKGGHDIPEATIRRRYDRSVRNLFQLYLPIVMSWKVYDNSFGGFPRLIAKGKRDQPEIVRNATT